TREPMQKIRKSRLALTLFLLFLTGWLAVTGQWKAIVNLPNKLEIEIRMADYDAYARSQGTTAERIAQEFYDRQVEANRKAQAAGQVECSFWSRGTNCYNRPVRGLPEIEHDIGMGDIIEGIQRTVAKSWPLLLPFLGSLIAALFLVYALPSLARRFWAWL